MTGDEQLCPQCQARLWQIVENERERGARIAEQYAKEQQDSDPSFGTAGTVIAELIRAGE